MTTRQQQQGGETAVIRAPQDGSEVGVVALAGPEEVRAALDANVAATRACRELPAYERAACGGCLPTEGHPAGSLPRQNPELGDLAATVMERLGQ